MVISFMIFFMSVIVVFNYFSILWMVNSVGVLLCLLIGYLILCSLVCYFFSSSFLISYFLVLSILGGLIVLVSFVLMMIPFSTNIIKYSFLEKVFYFFFMNVLLLMMYSLKINSWKYENLNFFSMDSQTSPLGEISVFPYVNLFMFLIIVLLFMLFVVDSLVKTKGGSMLMK